MIAGCYILHLYCDNQNEQHSFEEFPHEYTDEFGSTCRRIARKDGWRLSGKDGDLCPKCTKKEIL